ncbi:acylneuraminate cytidylyltransferase family protein [Methanococcus maripaludis]|jgi:CMP-N,N'-diacetyllegionaminic acid synthase|nr:acylneuraminate cytidylyltransferase family protein [Methanococcus maripaludis]
MRKILGIIPARSGSKGLKDKNILQLNGKPLIAYTIEAALKSGIFKDVIVSTDSEKYAKISRKYGAKVPFLRDCNLSSDHATSMDVILDVIEKMQKLGKTYDYAMLLQPTSPLRDEKDIINAYKILVEKNANSVVSVSEADHSPLLCNTLPEDLNLDDFLNMKNISRRQDLPKYYRINGAIYVFKIDYLIKYKIFYHDKCYAYVMDKISSVDIDDIVDFKLAEVLLVENLKIDK